MTSLPGGNQFGLGTQPAVRRVTTYKEFCEKRGITDAMRRPMRSLRFDFEQNEEEERAISEAIAKEEEMMRREDEFKAGRIPGHQSEFNSELWQSTGVREPLAMPLFPRTSHSILSHRQGDSNDTKIIKSMLDSMIMQVCKWDRIHGWYKQHMKSLGRRVDVDSKIGRRKVLGRAQEAALAERVDIIKREINKRRCQLEHAAELDLGVPAPWRRSRGRPTRLPRIEVSPTKRSSSVATRPSTVVNPAEISLGSPSQLLHRDDEIRRMPKEEKIEEEEIKQDEAPLASREENIGQRVHRKRTSDSESSSVQHSKRIKVEASDCEVDEEQRIGRDSVPPCGFCGKKYNSKKVYMQCCTCAKLFHARCLGVSEKKAKKQLSEWKCMECESAANQLYCVCRTPYDDSKFYVGCDACEGWYHPTCVGITKEEAETMAEYICPLCAAASGSGMAGPAHSEEATEEAEEGAEGMTTAQADPLLTAALGRADYALLWTIIDAITAHRSSWPFRNPTTQEDHPNYEEPADRPLDLSVIRTRLEQLQYESISGMVCDIQLMIANVRNFYHEDAILLECAADVERTLNDKVEEVRKTLIQRSRNRKPSECKTFDSCLDIDTDQLINITLDPNLFHSLVNSNLQ